VSRYFDEMRAREQDIDEEYERRGYPIPHGHPDELADAIAYRDEMHRYADNPEPWRALAREADDWVEIEEQAA
jgi:hypothetical protein